MFESITQQIHRYLIDMDFMAYTDEEKREKLHHYLENQVFAICCLIYTRGAQQLSRN